MVHIDHESQKTTALISWEAQEEIEKFVKADFQQKSNRVSWRQ